MSKDKPEELIILGNGFDLACGLKSSYKNFFKYRLFRLSMKNNIKLSSLNLAKKLEKAEKQPTIWDLIFESESKNKNDTRWSNIEEY